MRRAVLLAGVVAVAALALTAASSVAAGSLPTLTLSVTKNNVVVGGSKVSGPVDVQMTVTGEPSDAPGLILLKPGVTPAKFGKFTSMLGMDTPLDAIDPYATIVFDGAATAGAPTNAEVDLQPGTYVAVNNGNAHTVFKVTKSAHPAAMPKPAATVSSIEFGFRGADTLHDGELVRFENAGYLIHMFMYAQVASVASARKAEALLLKGNLNAAKKYIVAAPGGFAGPLSAGAWQQEVVTAPPGVYVMLCLMNTGDGREHYQLGMFRTFKVTK